MENNNSEIIFVNDLTPEKMRQRRQRQQQDMGLGKLNVHDLAALREILADVIDSGCKCETTTITKCDRCGSKGPEAVAGLSCLRCDGTMQAIPINHAQHPWLLYAASDFPDGAYSGHGQCCYDYDCPASSRTEDDANQQRLQFIDSVIAAIVKRAAPEGSVLI